MERSGLGCNNLLGKKKDAVLAGLDTDRRQLQEAVIITNRIKVAFVCHEIPVVGI